MNFKNRRICIFKLKKFFENLSSIIKFIKRGREFKNKSQKSSNIHYLKLIKMLIEFNLAIRK